MCTAPVKTATNPPAAAQTGDGFTPNEIESTLKPTLHKWQPRCTYNVVEICNLEPGPGCVTLKGRVVNLHDEKQSNRMPHAAKGCLNLVVRDDTGAISVRTSSHSASLIEILERRHF